MMDETIDPFETDIAGAIAGSCAFWGYGKYSQKNNALKQEERNNAAILDIRK